jgi:tRNA (cmo5U34)-methyltransferase
MSKDRLFQDSQYPIDAFRFDERVAAVFDNMVSRSVPFYGEIQKLVVQLTMAFAQPETSIYDLGCSTGTTLAVLSEVALPDVHLIGMDASMPMLDRARAKLSGKSVELICQDLNQPFTLKPASVVILNLVLQFLPRERRLAVLREVKQSLVPGGCVVIVEKVVPHAVSLRPLYTSLYHNFKRDNGYSDDEIQRKAQALHATLFPLTPDENRQLLLEAGFTIVEPFFQWVQFFGVMAQV